MSFLEECATFGGMCHFWRNVPFLVDFAIFGGICHFGGMGHFWRNGPFLEECAIHGKCVIFGGICHFWRNVPYLKNVSIFGGMCLLVIITPVIILTQIYKPDIYDTSPQVIRNLLFFLVNYLFFFCFSTYLGNYRGGVSPVPFLFEIPLHLDGNLLSSIIAVELK